MTNPIKAERATLFSQGTQPKQSRGRAATRPIGTSLLKPGMTIAALCAGALGVFMLVARSNDAQNLPVGAKRANKAQSTRPIQVAESDKKSTSVVAPDQSRRSLDYYTKGVRDSMFSAPQPPKPKVVEVAKPKALPPVKVPVVEINPFAEWTYSGTVSMGDEKMALLENRNTKDGQYLKVGDDFMGAKVATVTDQMVTLTSGKKPYLLAKADTINVTPLDRSAAYMTAQPQQAQQGQPQQPGGIPVMQTGGVQGAPAMTLPNGRTLTAEQAARFQSRMNSRFNGRGGAGAFGGGYGGGGRGGRNRGGGGPVMIAPGG